MTFFQKYKTNLLIILSAVLMGAGVLWYTQDVTRTALLLAGFSGVVVLFLILFYKLKWYYYFLIGLVPLSIDANIVGSAQISFPAEGLIALAVPILLLFNSEYRSTLVKIFKHPITILLGADLLVQFLASLTGTHIDVSLKRLLIRFIYIMVFYVMVNMISNRKELIYPWIAYLVGLIPVMYSTLRMHIIYDFNPRVVFSICQPYYSDHTVYGACLAFMVPVILIFLWRYKGFGVNKKYFKLILVAFVLVLISEFLALSRAAILSLGVALVFYVFLHFKVKFRSLITVLGFVAMIALMNQESILSNIQGNKTVSNDGNISNHFSSVTNVQSDASNLERINRWICAIRMYESRPILGYGPGTYQFEYNKFQTIENKTYISTNSGNKGNAHSEYLTYLSETGIFGILIYLITVFTSVYYGMQNHYHVKDPFMRYLNLGVLLGLVTYLFHGIFNAFIDQSKMAFLYFTAVGTIVWINFQLKKVVE